LDGTLGAGLSDVRVSTSGIALSVEGGDGVVVHGGSLDGGTAAVRALDARAVVLDGVATTGAVRGATLAPARDEAAAPGGTPRWRPVEGAGLVTLLLVAGAGLLEAGRSWRRRSIPSG
jgi:hypothetical protein